MKTRHQRLRMRVVRKCGGPSFGRTAFSPSLTIALLHASRSIVHFPPTREQTVEAEAIARACTASVKLDSTLFEIDWRLKVSRHVSEDARIFETMSRKLKTRRRHICATTAAASPSGTRSNTGHSRFMPHTSNQSSAVQPSVRPRPILTGLASSGRCASTT